MSVPVALVYDAPKTNLVSHPAKGQKPTTTHSEPAPASSILLATVRASPGESRATFGTTSEVKVQGISRNGATSFDAAE